MPAPIKYFSLKELLWSSCLWGWLKFHSSLSSVFATTSLFLSGSWVCLALVWSLLNPDGLSPQEQSIYIAGSSLSTVCALVQSGLSYPTSQLSWGSLLLPSPPLWHCILKNSKWLIQDRYVTKLERRSEEAILEFLSNRTTPFCELRS